MTNLTVENKLYQTVKLMESAKTKAEYDKLNDRAWNLMELKAKHNPF